MSSPSKQSARARLGAACLAVSMLAAGAGIVAAPVVASAQAEGETDPSWPDGPVNAPALGESTPDEDDDASEPAPDPTPDPTATTQPTPGASPTPDPSESSSPPSTPTPEPTSTPVAPPVEPSAPPAEETVPAPVVDVSSGEGRDRTPISAAARLGMLLRLPATEAPAPEPQPSDAAHVDGGPDVGGSAQLSASVVPEAATGRTDAVQVGALNDGSGSALAHPAAWAPWAGALAVAAVGAAVLVLRGGRQLGR
ncbi:MAG: hypothetical protein PGN24_05585 [Microbacterium arborescens]